MSKNFFILPIIFVLFTSSFVSFSYASIESEAQEDLLAGCRDSQTLVYRFTYLDYVCVDPSTAERWEELKIAEIVKEFSAAPITEKKMPLEVSDTSIITSSPPKKLTSDSDVVCRDGQILILKLSYNDTMCANMDTAKKWERLGIAEIIEDVELFDKKSPLNVDESDSDENILDLGICEPTDSSYSIISPNFLQVSNGTWVVFGDDVVNSAFIEGDDGIIAINTLNCYDVAKQSLNELRSFTEKPIKIIIFTSISDKLVDGSRAYLEEGDGDVEFIIHNNLMESLIAELNSDDQIIHSFASRFGVDVSGIELKLIHVEDEYQEHLYIHQSQSNELLIGNDMNGLLPFLIHLDNFQ